MDCLSLLFVVGWKKYYSSLGNTFIFCNSEKKKKIKIIAHELGILEKKKKHDNKSTIISPYKYTGTVMQLSFWLVYGPIYVLEKQIFYNMAV